jgi:hypothetical protein
MSGLKEYIKDLAYNVKKVLPLKDDLDKIIESEYQKAFESLDKYGIIEYIESKYKINYIKPKLKILEDEPSFMGMYSKFENEINFSKKSIERRISEQLKFLGYKKIEGSTDDTQDMKYLNRSYNSKFLYPFYINKRNIREAIAEFLTRSATFHEVWHSIDYSILYKPFEGSIIKDINILTSTDEKGLMAIYSNIPTYSINTIYHFLTSTDLDVRASAFEVIMYYLVNGFHKHEKGLMAVYSNIPICRKYIEKIDELEKNENRNKYVPYELGLCCGNTILAANKSSLEKNIYNIIDDILNLNKEMAIDVIKRYGDNHDKLLHD